MQIETQDGNNSFQDSSHEGPSATGPATRPKINHQSSPDLSPPRRRGQDCSDVPRYGKDTNLLLHTSNVETSHDPDIMQSMRSQSLDLMPPRRLRHDSPDLSPPRKRRQDYSDTIEDETAVNPPLHAFSVGTSHDESGIQNVRSGSIDLSPPRRQRHDSPDLAPQRRSKERLPASFLKKDKKQSPSRATLREQDNALSRGRAVHLEAVVQPDSARINGIGDQSSGLRQFAAKPHDRKMADGSMAGMVSGSQLKVELKKRKAQDLDRYCGACTFSRTLAQVIFYYIRSLFGAVDSMCSLDGFHPDSQSLDMANFIHVLWLRLQRLGPSAMGSQAETIYRNKDGKRVTLEELEKEEKKKKVRIAPSSWMEWWNIMLSHPTCMLRRVGSSLGEMGEC